MLKYSNMERPLPPLSRPSAKRLPRDHRIASILHTARIVLRERGSEQFLTSEVAQRCGVSEGTIYKYFSTKRELLQRVAEDWFEEFLTEDPPSNPDEPIRERLFRVIWRNLWGIKKEPALTRFVLLELRPDPDFRKMKSYEQNRRFAAMVTDVVAEGIRRGELRGDVPPKVIRDMIFGAIEHQTWAYLRGEGDFSVDDSASAIADVITNGLGQLPRSGSVATLVDVASQLQESIGKLSAGVAELRHELASTQNLK
jgi:TetR/AcrR family transcriptional regulator, fatty acid metabolism regulator protein